MADNLFSSDVSIDKSYDASSIQVLEDMSM